MQFEQVTKDQRRRRSRSPRSTPAWGSSASPPCCRASTTTTTSTSCAPSIEASAEASHTDADGPHAVSHRVIADHLRATSFLIADGVLPSNEGRGYVLRRIMRRAMRHIHKLGQQDPMMWKLVPALVAQMGTAYPELVRAQGLITETLKLEEARFKQMLARGLGLLDDETARLRDDQPLPGEVAFKLYDTFGFPLDLTQDILRGQGKKVDNAGFDAAMERQRAAARKAWAGSGEAATEGQWFELREKLGATEFLGLFDGGRRGKVIALLVDNKPVQSAEAGAKVVVIANQTPFYGESGGQMGDRGIMFNAGGVEIAINDTQKKLGDLFIHLGTRDQGQDRRRRRRGDARRRRAPHRARAPTTRPPTCCTRRCAAGSARMSRRRARWWRPTACASTSSHPKPLSPDDIRAIETEVNNRIRLNADVATRLMTPDDAVKAGALALFGEKYGDEVRVVSMGGADDDKALLDRALRRHPCAPRRRHRLLQDRRRGRRRRRRAPHRRPHGQSAFDYVVEREKLLAEAADALKIQPAELPGRIAALVEERRKLERELSDARRASPSAARPAASLPTATAPRMWPASSSPPASSTACRPAS